MTVCPKCERLVIDSEKGCEHCASTKASASPTAPAATPTETPVASTGLRRRDLVMIVAVIAGSGALTVGLLSSRPKSAATSAAAPGVPAGSMRTAGLPTVPTAHWTDRQTTWIGADHRGRRKGFAFELEARNDTQVWMRKVRPLLVVRCTERQLEAFVFTDSAAAMEADTDDHTVRIALDEEAERTQRWQDSSAHDALFAPGGADFVAELSRARVMRFAYTPHNAGPATAHFDVAGLQERLASVPDCRTIK